MKVNRSKLARKLHRAAERTPDQVGRARIECAEDLLSVALPRTPLSVKRYESDPEPGQLRESGYVDHESIPDASEVGFSSPIAAIVHDMPEDTDWTTPGTHGRWLELSYLENKALYAKRIMDAAREGLHG